MNHKEDFYVRPSALTKLSRGSEFFLLRRSNTAYGNGMYTLPSGVIDGGETAKDAAIRETEEEAGVILNPGEVTLVHTLHRKLPDGKEWIDLFFQSDTWEGEPKINEPHRFDDSGWFTIDNIPENTLDFVVESLKNIEKGESYSDFGFDK